MTDDYGCAWREAWLFWRWVQAKVHEAVGCRTWVTWKKTITKGALR